MKVSIFGLGYVGCVGMGCMSSKGHEIIGVDVNPEKIAQINSGHATIIEEGIDELISNGYEKGLIKATSDTDNAVKNTDVSFITVGTPNSPTGHLDLNTLYKVAENIGISLKQKNSFHIVVIRSTVTPGTNSTVTKIISQACGKRENIDFAVVSNPEFLREGSAINDYFNPELTVIGTECEKAYEILLELYKDINSKFHRASIKSAEIIKYLNNTYHALKIAFANEIGSICKELEIDSHEVMDLFCMDKRLNISPAYFKPGYAYGGSCLPKDLKALNSIAHDKYLDVPILSSIETSNTTHKNRILEYILTLSVKKIGVLGLSFKKGTDDLRNSASVELVERLLGKGYWVNIYDKSVHLARLTGTNKQEIERRIPRIAEYISDDLSDVINKSELIVITYNEDAFKDLPERYPDKTFIDLARIKDDKVTKGNYYGLSW